jgi:ubiquinone/menaquinone biosynthesis C-methylase UbiE
MPSPLQQSWNQVAAEYHKYIAPGLRPAAVALCRAVKISPADRVLDIACGPGTAAFEAGALGASRVLGIDFAFGMVALAREIARAQRGDQGGETPGIRFVQASALALPVRTEATNVAISNFGAIFAPDAPAFVVEVARVLTAGGRLALTAWPREGAIGAYYDLVDRHIVPAPSPHDPHAWAQPERAEGWLAPLFNRITTSPLSLPFTAESPEDAWDKLKRSTGRVSSGYASLSPGARRRMDFEMVGFFSGFAGPGGICWQREARLITATRR